MGNLDLLREDASQTDIREHMASGRPAAITIRIPETLRDAAKEKEALKCMSFSAYVREQLFEGLTRGDA